jgi:hypothetical protein
MSCVSSKSPGKYSTSVSELINQALGSLSMPQKELQDMKSRLITLFEVLFESKILFQCERKAWEKFISEKRQKKFLFSDSCGAIFLLRFVIYLTLTLSFSKYFQILIEHKY